MSITNTVTRSQYTGNGAQVLYSITFDYRLTTEIKVYLNDVLKVVNVDYILADSGGNASVTPTHIKFNSAPANAVAIEIARQTAKTQEVSLLSNSSITLLNDALDKLTQMAQELGTGISDLVSTSDLVELEAEIYALETEIDTAKTDIDNVEAAVAALGSRADTLESDVSTLQSAVSTLTADLNTAENDIANVEAGITVLQNAIAVINADISSLTNRVSALEAYFGAVGEEVLTNNASHNLTILLNKINTEAAILEFAIFRKTDTNSKYSSGFVHFVYSAFTDTWRVEKSPEVLDYSGVVFAISGAGQVSVTNSNIAGTNYSGKIKYNLKKFEV